MEKSKIVLLVVDVQKALIEGKPLDSDLVLDNIKKLIEYSRNKKIEVIYVQHCGKDGGPLEVNSDGWQIHNKIAPKQDERVFIKYFNSAFKETGLKEYLNNKDINKLIITGMQTEYCIDTTCKVAYEYGFNLTIPEKTNTTFDNGNLKAEDIYNHYNFNIFNKRFANVVSIDSILNS